MYSSGSSRAQRVGLVERRARRARSRRAGRARSSGRSRCRPRSPGRSSSGSTSAAFAHRPTLSARRSRLARRQRSTASSRSSACLVEVAGLEPAPDASRSTSTHSATPSFIVTASGCAPPMPPRPAVSVTVPGERAAEAPPRDLGEALVGALHDPLAADVDPRAGGHLAVHRQPERLEPAELVPGGPLADQVRVRDQHARRPLVRAEHAHRLAGLDEQRLVVGERPQRAHDRVEGLPGARRLARCRRRRRARPAARRRPGRGCSSASAAPPPAASRGRTSSGPAGRAHGPRAHSRLPIAASTASTTAPDATSASASASSGDSQRSGPGPGHRRAHGRERRGGARAGLERRAQVERRARRR